jgi:sulfate permease, SulP family
VRGESSRSLESLSHGRLALDYLSRSVVGGYLAYIGWFCGLAGVGLMVGSANVTLAVAATNWVYILPGVVGGVAIYLAVSHIRHPATLPIGILLEIGLFYGLLWLTGTTVPEATSLGWIPKMDPAPAWYSTWDFLRLDLVDWMALPGLIGTEWVAMLFVCALSSSLDVAALELELNKPLDYNHELKMIGLSNVLSGATGGYTGSYIFSQSIFSLRAGVRSRLAGYALALCEMIYVVMSFPILAYIPNFFFGSLLCLIALDLMYEWLWDIRRKLTPVEFAITLATFGCINLIKVQYGILAGVGLYLLCSKMGLDVRGAKFAPSVGDAGSPTETR